LVVLFSQRVPLPLFPSGVALSAQFATPNPLCFYHMICQSAFRGMMGPNRQRALGVLFLLDGIDVRGPDTYKF
jgi:hypothetical protein